MVRRNAERARNKARELGVRLRPHVKTHKCAEVARLQVVDPRAITVSTLAEAGFFAAAGFDDIIWAVPVVTARLPEVAELAARVERMSIVLDHPAALDGVEEAARSLGVRFSAYLKVDCGGGRAGVDPVSRGAVDLGERLSSSKWVDFRGLLTHAGQAYSCTARDEIEVVAETERAAVVGLAERLRRRGVEVPELSVGSTPTFAVVSDLEGITEARPGNYIFHDAFQVAIGSCRLDDVAFSVLAAVIGSYPDRGEIVVNAGALALSKDRGPVHVDPECGFGLMLAPSGQQIEGLRVASLTQEHAVVRCARPELLDHFPIGATVRIIPNHSCLAAACFDRYHVVENGEVVDEWRPARGW